MKAAAFDFVRAQSLADACALLARHRGAARLLAGGQSLLPAMNMRLVAPELLIDIGGLDDLRTITLEGATLKIGALVRHADLLRAPEIARYAPMIAEGVAEVAHPAIRNRGTIGGNLAHADPASELPACMVALRAVLVATGPGGSRRIAAENFFTGLFETALAEDEVLSSIEVPILASDQRDGFAELARRRGDYAIVGLACRATLGDGRLDGAHLAFFGVGDRPMPAVHAATALCGTPDTAIRDAQAALAEDLSPQGDGQASAATRLHLARVLLGRVLTPLLADARQGPPA